MGNRRSIGCSGILVAVLLLWAGCFVWSFRNNFGTSATADGAAVRNLPPGATDISWLIPGTFGPNTAYEFTVDQAGFEQWIRDDTHLELEGPKRGPFEILTYDQPTGAFAMRELENTIAYTLSEEDRGVYLVYDLDNHRAYYESHSR